MQEAEMKGFVRLALSLGVLFAAGCGSDSTAPIPTLHLISVDGKAIPAVVSNQDGFTWSIVSGTLTGRDGDAACGFKISLARSGQSGTYDSMGGHHCDWSNGTATIAVDLGANPPFGSHTYTFVP
jgi:hypothetical protein